MQLLNFKLIREKIFIYVNIDDDINIIYSFVMQLNTDKKFSLFNFILILKFCAPRMNFNSSNTIEKKFLKSINNYLLEKLVLLEIFQQVMEQSFNESIDKSVDLLKRSEWVAKSLESMYSYQIVISHLTDDRITLILPRTEKVKEARKKILNNLIISSLLRYDGIILYYKESRAFSTLPPTIGIKSTEGFTVLVEPASVQIFKHLLYIRKIYQVNPIVLSVYHEFIQYETFTTEKKPFQINTFYLPRLFVRDFINNSTYTSPLWLKFEAITDCDIGRNLPILNKLIGFEELLDNINYLNGTPLTVDWNLLASFDTLFANDNSLTLDFFVLEQVKRRLHNNVLMLEDDKKIETSDPAFQKIVNSVITFDLLKKQFNRIREYEKGVFYLQYRLDTRTRVYVYNWPVNYQLNHVVRSLICFKPDEGDSRHELFLKLPEISENLYTSRYFIYDSLVDKEKTIRWVNENIITVNTDLENLSFADKVKIESVLMVLWEFSPKSVSLTSEKEEFWILNFNRFVDSSLHETWKEWASILQVDDEEILYLFKLQASFKKLMQDDFSSIIWLDASSNALQLVTLRTGAFNDLLLQTTNIKENKTPFPNIYYYGHYLLCCKDHEKICTETGISVNELLLLTDVKDFKYRAMPATYGKTAYANTDDMNSKYEHHEVWKKLSSAKKKRVAKYFWNLTFEVLKEIEYDIEKYLSECKTVGDKIPNWFSDFDLPIVPFSYKKSQRQKLRERLSKAKSKLTLKPIPEDIGKLEKSVENYKKKISIDEKTFWARMRINLDVKLMTIRIPKDVSLLDYQKMKIGLAANTIHAYDASVLLLTIKICRKLNIKVLVIHDSVGCSAKDAPLVKTIFKIANIIILKKNQSKAPYPLKTPIKIENPEILYKDILESNNFFR